ncbi:hypothetical protein AKG34_11220 [Peribacillus butanolivorans]|uniref:hypothetical protein n=1 Tax=Peribacillus butanolivorans TaxID=421767 RepID=UPI0006A74E6B|nr:hypothetical protein [Peribacillus butanolivorans]KON69279.1 hypothetical protein AKG34_11220 [Peribacillus butanolivorans]
MSKSKKILLSLLGIFLIILAGAAILMISFTQRMKAFVHKIIAKEIKNPFISKKPTSFKEVGVFKFIFKKASK